MADPINIEKAQVSFSSISEDAAKKWDSLRKNEETSYVLLGTATCGRAAGAMDVKSAFEENFKVNSLDVPVIEVGCLGHCYAEPMAIVKRPGYPEMLYHSLTPIIVKNLVNLFFLQEDPYFDIFLGAMHDNEMMLPKMDDTPRYGMEERRLLAKCGIIDPDNIDDAISNGAYSGFLAALKMTPEECLGSLEKAGLRGLGGAGFPIFKKWEILKAQPRRHKHLICNADEGDPGAFMDRTILESDPHAVLEGMLIGAHITGAENGFIYVRAEYPLAVTRLKDAIKTAIGKNLLGRDILGSGFSFNIQGH